MSERKVFEDNVIPLPDQPGPTAQGLMMQPTEPEHGNERDRSADRMVLAAWVTVDRASGLGSR